MKAEANWPEYYAATSDRPAWDTTRRAVELFDAERLSAADRRAVDLGCGGGRDTRFLLDAGWSVTAIDREPTAISTLLSHVAEPTRPRLETRVQDMGEAELPRCLLVVANASLPFLNRSAYRRVWQRIMEALEPGGRVALMLFGDRDEFAGDRAMTCRSPRAVRSDLREFTIEHWSDREEDRTTALGEPHHYHLIEVVARR